jgi:hypothetical protein
MPIVSPAPTPVDPATRMALAGLYDWLLAQDYHQHARETIVAHVGVPIATEKKTTNLARNPGSTTFFPSRNPSPRG